MSVASILKRERIVRRARRKRWRKVAITMDLSGAPKLRQMGKGGFRGIRFNSYEGFLVVFDKGNG